MKNEPSFYEKTTRRFAKNNTSFLEGILCSLGKDLKLVIHYTKSVIRS